MNEALKRANAIKRNGRAIKKKEGFRGPEKILQSQCEDYLKIHQLKYIHIPDHLLAWISQKAPQWIKTIVSRMFKGVPDLLIFLQDRCLLVELKNRSGTVSQGQRNWAKNVTVHLVRDFDTFRNLVDKFMEEE